MNEEQAFDDIKAIIESLDSCCKDQGLVPCGEECVKLVLAYDEPFDHLLAGCTKPCEDCCGECFKGEST